MPNACVFTVIAHRPEHPQNMLNTLHTHHTQNTNGRKLRGNACSDRPKAGFPPPVLTTAQPSVGERYLRDLFMVVAQERRGSPYYFTGTSPKVVAATAAVGYFAGISPEGWRTWYGCRRESPPEVDVAGIS